MVNEDASLYFYNFVIFSLDFVTDFIILDLTIRLLIKAIMYKQKPQIPSNRLFNCSNHAKQASASKKMSYLSGISRNLRRASADGVIQRVFNEYFGKKRK